MRIPATVKFVMFTGATKILSHVAALLYCFACSQNGKAHKGEPKQAVSISHDPNDVAGMGGVDQMDRLLSAYRNGGGLLS
jgi:hypothetical protein